MKVETNNSIQNNKDNNENEDAKSKCSEVVILDHLFIQTLDLSFSDLTNM